jgi:hypothetical protein
MLLLIFSTTIKANTDVVFINKDSPAPFDGILFTESKAKELRADILESEKTKILLQSQRNKSDTLHQIIELKETEIELYRKENKRLLVNQNMSSTLNYVWFGLGVLATGIAVYGAGSLAR